MGDVITEGAAPLDFDLARQDGSTLLTLRGELDISNTDEVQAAVGPMIERHPDRLIIETRELRFADTSAIALWVKWTGTVKVEIRNPPPLLRRVIDSMGLPQTLPMAP